ncbi:MAG: glucose 1-dehydrogenase [Pseudomonadota bacterium]
MSEALIGKSALITGSASGFGLGIARHFVAAGARVGLMDINSEATRHAAAELGPQAVALTTDITNIAQIKSSVEQFQATGAGVDILVNNAGVGHLPQPLEQIESDAFERILDVNIRSIYLLSSVIVPIMKTQERGCILNIASTAGISPRPGLTWYNASKGWVITATKSMAIELAPSKIRVNALSPVAGDTPLLATFMGGDTPQLRESFINSIPLGRLSTPDDIAAAAVFLCSDAADLITGVALEVDGGRCI